MTELPTYDHLTNRDLLRLYRYHDSRLVQALLERLEMAVRDIEDLTDEQAIEPLPETQRSTPRPRRA